jgi:hypothetical protein
MVVALATRRSAQRPAIVTSLRSDEMMERWSPEIEPNEQEEWILRRLTRVRKLFAFLRNHRHELFDDAFQTELESMYHNHGGTDPKPPALMCMALLLQGHSGTSDAEAVELTIVDLRWQMVLGCLGAQAPAFSQGALQQFRERLVAADMDRRLLERTVDLARQTAEFDWKQIPKTLRVAMDSRPLVGAGRVEDTINLLGHAARKMVECAAEFLEISTEQVCKAARLTLFDAGSVKASLDLDWSDPEQKAAAIERVEREVNALHTWIERKMPGLVFEEPLRPYIEAATQVKAQDLETTAQGRVQIRQGVAPDRRISIEDSEERHGRKSKSNRFNGYKEHIAPDLDTGLIMACAVTPANRPEEEAAAPLRADVERQGRTIEELQIDRGYLNSPIVPELLAAGKEVICKPWPVRNSHGNLFTKNHFKIDTRAMTITCPAGEVESFEPGAVVQFDPDACGPCELRTQCTHAASGRGRTVTMAEDEALQQRLRKLQGTPGGREMLRNRTKVEHALAHIAARKGDKARYIGTRKNLFDLRRAAAIQNLEIIHRKIAA